MLSLDQIDPSDYQKVGPKAASLARLRHRCGLQVPEAVVIDNHWLHLFLDSAGLSSKVELLKQILWTIRQEHLEKVSSEVVSGLRSTTLPDELERSLLDALRENALDRGRLACRSSSSLEDSRHSVFPGVFLSVLGTSDLLELRQAIVNCYASLFEMRALKYVLSRRLPETALEMSLIVQSLVAAEVSGVAFSRDPINPDAKATIVEAVPGLSDGLVSGREAPFRFSVYEDGSSEMTDEPQNSRPQAPREILTRSRLSRLGEICRQLQQEWEQHVDVEFAFVANQDEPYMLQCRPMLTSPLGGAAEQRWSRLAQRSYPGIACAGGVALGVGFNLRLFRGDVRQMKDKILLVEKLTTDDYEAIFSCRGIVSERHDSQLNHVSIACREIGLPYLAAVEKAREELNGQFLALDANSGLVHLLPSEIQDSETSTERVERGSASIQEVAYLPLLENTKPTGEVRFHGIDLLILETAQKTADKVGFESALAEQLDLALEAQPEMTLLLPPPSLAEEEVEVLNRCLTGIQLTPKTLCDWFDRVIGRMRHRERVLRKDEKG